MHQNTDVIDVVDGVVVDVTDSKPLAGGVLDIVEGLGFLRGPGLVQSDQDIYVSQSQIRRFELKTGDMVFGEVRPPDRVKRGEIYYAMMEINAINDRPPEEAKRRIDFKDATFIEPGPIIDLSMAQTLGPRLVDLWAPLRHGDGALLKAARKVGKTTLMLQILETLEENYSDLILMVVLVGERKHEVTRYIRNTNAIVFAAPLDATVEDQVQVAKLALENAKRRAEGGDNIFVALDGITRLTRAYNIVAPSGGGYLSGGLNPSSVHGPESPKGRFASYGNIEGAGSVTVLATVLVDTGSKMDSVVAEEMEGTGTSGILLDLKLAEAEIFPAIDPGRSSTRLSPTQLRQRGETEAWKAVIDTCLRFNWGHINDRRRALHQLMRQHRNLDDVGAKIVQRVLKGYPGRWKVLGPMLEEKPDAWAVLGTKLAQL